MPYEIKDVRLKTKKYLKYLNFFCVCNVTPYFHFCLSFNECFSCILNKALKSFLFFGFHTWGLNSGFSLTENYHIYKYNLKLVYFCSDYKWNKWMEIRLKIKSLISYVFFISEAGLIDFPHKCGKSKVSFYNKK